MEILKKKLSNLIESLAKEDKAKLKYRLEDLISVYPFNEYEYIISTLFGLKRLTLDSYLEIRGEYVARNMYLYIFEISAPRGFGEQWAQGHIKELAPELIKPTKKIDKKYSGEYDFFFEGIKIEIKASRAVDFNSQEALYVKALSFQSNKPFDMNFQQIKPKCCHVFIWVAVWRDVIKYWVLNYKEVERNKYYSTGQHRGNVGEGQLHVTKDNIREFDKYDAKPRELLKTITGVYKRLSKISKDKR